MFFFDFFFYVVVVFVLAVVSSTQGRRRGRGGGFEIAKNLLCIVFLQDGYVDRLDPFVLGSTA